MNRLALALLSVLIGSQTIAIGRGGLVEDPAARNHALIVGVGHGLPGIQHDVDNVAEIAALPAYHYDVTTLEEQAGTIKAIQTHLSEFSSGVSDTGSLLFYFSGHGAKGAIWAQDKFMMPAQVREAIEKPRAGIGPIKRLVLIFDTCHSGLLLSPFRFTLDESETFVDAIVNEFAKTRGAYWENLFVFASSRSDEKSFSAADGSGSRFTLGLAQAFDEVSTAGGKVNDFIAKTQKYTKGSHPVARLVPPTLGDEKL